MQSPNKAKSSHLKDIAWVIVTLLSLSGLRLVRNMMCSKAHLETNLSKQSRVLQDAN